MRKWIRKANRLIASTKGESLMESLASLLVMSILLLAVTAMVQTSLKMTGMSMEEAKTMQEDSVNAAITSDYSGNLINITFSSGSVISSTHEIKFTNDNGIIAFDPED